MLTELRARKQIWNLPIRMVIDRHYVTTFGCNNVIYKKFLFEIYTKISRTKNCAPSSPVYVVSQ